MENRRPPRNRSSSTDADRSRGPARSVRPRDGNHGPGQSSANPSAQARDHGQAPPYGGGRDGHRNGPGGSRDFYRGRPVQSGRTVGPRGRKPLDTAPPIPITSDLQLTDGKFRGRLLANSLRPRATPTPRMVREMMFRLISRRVRAGRFLDLCAGCGVVGLEAISRGAMLVTFVERSARVASHLRANLKEIGVHENRGQVQEIEAIPFLSRSAKRKRVWDIVYVGHIESKSPEIIETIARARMLAPGGVIVIEHRVTSPLPDELGNLRRWRNLEKDGYALSFYNRKP